MRDVVALRQPGGDGVDHVSPSTQDLRDGDSPDPDGVRYLQGFGVLVDDDGSAVAALTGTREPRVAAALRGGKAVVFHPRQLGPGGTVRMNILRTAASSGAVDERTVSIPAVLVTTPISPDEPAVPASLLPRLGADVSATPSGVVASTTRTPTDDEEQRLRARAGDVGAYVERGYQAPSPIVLLVIGTASVADALGSTLAVVGLAAAEGRADVATLAAVGAAPRVRRRLAAAQAGVVAVLGTVLGCVSGVVSGATLVLLNRRDDLVPVGIAAVRASAPWEVVVPWGQLALLAVGLPLLAVVAAAAFTRSRLPLVRRLGQ